LPEIVMRTEGQRRSDNFEDRGRGAGGGGLPAGALFAILRRIGLRGVLIVLILLAGVYFLAPPSIKAMVFGALFGGVPGQEQSAGAGSACDVSTANTQACDFSRVVLASTEDVWASQFQQNRLPNYGAQRVAYQNPTLVVYSEAVATDGCGNATADVGPFYCPNDRKLYVDPAFYQVMAQRLHAPGDFAQAYVIAHEVGHHVQNLIGATQLALPGENQNQTSVRIELQADCFAGVWGHTARAQLAVDDADLREALNAAHSIGDDTLGARESQYTHGTSAQRVTWFRRGFDSGDARQCDTFAVRDYSRL
jgi:predicted metalloprotease